MSDENPQPAFSETALPSKLGRLKERFLGRDPGEAAMAEGKQLSTARLEGDELMRSAWSGLTAEQQRAAEFDEVVGGIEAKRHLVMTEAGMQATIADYVAGKGTISAEQEAQIREAVGNGRIDTMSLALQILDDERTAAAKQEALIAARGELPDESWEREKALAVKLEAGEARQLAAGVEITAALQRVLAEGELTSDVFNETRGLARTMVRAEGGVRKTLGRLQNRLGKRFPERADELASHAEAFRGRRANEAAAITLPERVGLAPEAVVQRARELVRTHGVQDSEVAQSALKALGVTFEGEGDAMQPVIKEGSLAACLFETRDFNAQLDHALEVAVAASADNPRLARHALEAAHITFQGRQIGRALEAKAQRVGLLAAERERQKFEQQLSSAENQQAGMERRKNASAWLNKQWSRVEGAGTILATGTSNGARRVENTLRRAYTSARKTVLDGGRSIQSHAQNLGARVEARIESVAPSTERQAEVAGEIARLEARLAELRGGQSFPQLAQAVAE